MLDFQIFNYKLLTQFRNFLYLYMMSFRSRKIRLEPNNKQETKFNQHAGVARHAYNIGLEFCNLIYEENKMSLSAIDLHKWLVSDIKSENPWYYDVSKCAPQQALRNLRSAFDSFHRIQKPHNYGLKDKKGRLQGFPNFKKKYVKDKFYLEENIRIEEGKIKLPRIGWVKLSEKVNDMELKNCVISRTADQWFVSFREEFEPRHAEKQYEVVGVDLGIKTLATLSNGEVFQNNKPYNKAKSKLRRIDKEVSRRRVVGAKNQSENYKKSLAKRAKLYARIANVRKNTLHKLTTYLAKNFETVAIEDLKVKNMVKNHNLASAILDGGFYEFKRQLLYKKEWYGGEVIIADAFFPSSKLCSSCGNKKSDLKLSDRTYNCDLCRLSIDRDLNASLNLMNLAVSSTVTAFGDGRLLPSGEVPVDELGMKQQKLTFV